MYLIKQQLVLNLESSWRRSKCANVLYNSTKLSPSFKGKTALNVKVFWTFPRLYVLRNVDSYANIRLSSQLKCGGGSERGPQAP